MSQSSRRERRERRQRRATSQGLKALSTLKTQFRIEEAKERQYAQDRAALMATIYILLDGQGGNYRIGDEDRDRIITAMGGTNLRIAHDDEKKEWSIEIVRTETAQDRITAAAEKFKSDLKIRTVNEPEWETVETGAQLYPEATDAE